MRMVKSASGRCNMFVMIVVSRFYKNADGVMKFEAFRSNLEFRKKNWGFDLKNQIIMKKDEKRWREVLTERREIK